MEDGKRHAQTDTFNIKIADFNPFVIPSNASLWPVLFKENVSKFRLAYSRCFCIHFTEEKNHLGTSSFIISQVFIWSRFVTMNDIVIIAFVLFSLCRCRFRRRRRSRRRNSYDVTNRIATHTMFSFPAIATSLLTI